MREIKFRVWDIKEKRMTAVNLTSMDEDCMPVPPKWWDDIIHPFDEEECILMQYTGLKDKNGKEIFEGDILDGLLYREPTRQVVEFSAGFEGDGMIMGGWYLSFDDEWDDDESYNPPRPNAVIIGNIYENPDLEVKR